MSDLTQFSRSPSKKHCSNGDSQLSDLPDGIISQILSCLQTHEAVRTSVLSKDWEHKWTSLYDIKIIDDKKMYYWRKDKRTLFLDFMERIIGLPLNVQSFSLSLSGSYGVTRLNRWISNVFKRDVESLELICRHGNIDLPSSHFSCVSLRKLKLQLPCTFRLFQVPSCFPNLTNLSLHGVDILMEHSINDDTSKLTFPVLDTFELKFCTWLDVKYVDIYAPALTTFISENDNISETGEAKYYPVKLLGASVKQCKLLASYWHIQVIQQDHHLLENIGLRVQMQLKEFQGLEELELSGDVAKVIAQSKHKVPLPMFYKLKRLVLSSMDSLKPLFELLHGRHL